MRTSNFLSGVLTSRFTIILWLFISFIGAKGQDAKLMFPLGSREYLDRAVFSPDGKLVITIPKNGDDYPNVWDVSSGKFIYGLDFTGQISKIVFSKDGRFIIGSKIEGVNVWETNSGKLIHSFPDYADTYHEELLLSGDEKYVITSTDRDGYSLMVWDFLTGQLKYKLREKIHGPEGIFSPNGKFILTASNYGGAKAKLLKSSSGKLQDSLEMIYEGKKYNHFVNLKFSQDGKYIIGTTHVNSSDLILTCVWEMPTGKFLYSIKSSVSKFTFSPDGKYVLSYGNQLVLWQISSGKKLDTLSHDNEKAIFSPDGKFILTKNYYGIFLFDLTGKLLFELKDFIGRKSSFTFSPDGKYFIVAGEDKTARLWETSTRKLINSFQDKYIITNAIFSPNGKFVLTTCEDGTAKIWGTISGKLYNTLKNSIAESNAVVYSPRGKYYAFVSNYESIIIIETLTGKIVTILKNIYKYRGELKFSPDENSIVVMDVISIKVYDLLSGSLKYFLNKDDVANNFKKLEFSPDGKHIATITHRGITKLWETDSGKLVWQIENHGSKYNSILGMAFSNDGKYLATSSKDTLLVLLETSTGKLIYKLQGKVIKDSKFLFSADGKFIITTSRDEKAKFWELETGNLSHILKGDSFSHDIATKIILSKKYTVGVTPDSLKIWQNSNRELIQVREHKFWKHSDFMLSTEGNYLIEDDWKIYDLLSGDIKYYFKSFTHAKKEMIFSPNEKHLLTTSNYGTVNTWENNSGSILYSLALTDSNEYVVADTNGRYDGTPAGIAKLYYTCGTHIIEPNELKNPGFEPNLVSKLMNEVKEPLYAKKLSELDVCDFTPKVVGKGIQDGNYIFEVARSKGGLSQLELYIDDTLVKIILPSQINWKKGKGRLKVKQAEVESFFQPKKENTVRLKAKM